MDQDPLGDNKKRSHHKKVPQSFTKEEFCALRQKCIEKHSLDLETPRSYDRVWLARYIFGNDPGTRHNRIAGRKVKSWFGWPKKAVDRPVRYHTLEELFALPTWQIRAEIESLKLWKGISIQAEKVEEETTSRVWYREGSLPGNLT